MEDIKKRNKHSNEKNIAKSALKIRFYNEFNDLIWKKIFEKIILLCNWYLI